MCSIYRYTLASALIMFGSLIPIGSQTNAVFADTITVTSPYSEGTFHVKNLQDFADALQTQIWPSQKISLHHSASRVSHADSIEALKSNDIQIAEIFMSRLDKLHPIFTADSIPFLAINYDDADNMWQSQKELVDKVLESHGLIALYAVPWPAQNFYSNIELSSGADFNGTRLRSYSSTISSMATLLGAQPVMIEAKDLEAALNAKQVDIIVTSPSTGVSTSLWNHTDKYTKVGGWLPKNIILMNRQVFANLDPNQQKLLLKISKDFEQKGWALSQRETFEKENELRKKGMVILQPTKALLVDLNVAGATMFGDWRKASRSWLQENLPVKHDDAN
ncbi:MAG: TRAP transporter substrate-binding protein DctP [Amylibacter sp.]